MFLIHKPVLALALPLLAGSPTLPAADTQPSRSEEVRVSWQPWSPETFGRAKVDGKLVLVDAEAKWCHWCHVMDEQTYGNVGIVRLLRTGFVSIKADIDLHPDARELYEDIGWPGTTIYAPNGIVVYRHQGYLSPIEFKPVLEDLLAQQKAGRLKAWEGETKLPVTAPPQGLPALRERALKAMDDTFDENHGGWGEQKYPVAMNLEAAFAEGHRRRDTGWKLRALYTLAQQRHITDPVWGGIYQYSVGPTWHRIHFEKLTSLQALYLENLAEAFRATGDEDWLGDADRVLGFLRRFLQHPDGGFSATMDADLGSDGKTAPFLDGHAYYALGDAERLRRGLPRIDTRRYAREQGLVISALAAMYRARPEPHLLAEAHQTLAYLEARLSREGGYLHAEGAEGAFYLADQAACLKGLLALYEVTGDPTQLARAEALAAFIDRTLQDSNGLYRSRTQPKHAVGAFSEVRTPFDDNLVLARGLLRLHACTGAEIHREHALAILKTLGSPSSLEGQGRWLGDFVLAAGAGQTEASHLAIIGPKGDPRTEALFQEALALWHPGLIILRHDPAEGAPRNPDLGFPPVKVPTAFLCGGGRCSPPFTNPETLAEEIRKVK